MEKVMPMDDSYYDCRAESTRMATAAGLRENISLRKIVFVNSHVEEIEGRVRALLRDTYIDSKIIRFVPCPLEALVKKCFRLVAPFPKGMS